MDRFSLTDAQWEKILDEPTDPGCDGEGRLFVEALSGIARAGSLWHDLPLGFGK